MKCMLLLPQPPLSWEVFPQNWLHLCTKVPVMGTLICDAAFFSFSFSFLSSSLLLFLKSWTTWFFHFPSCSKQILWVPSNFLFFLNIQSLNIQSICNPHCLISDNKHQFCTATVSIHAGISPACPTVRQSFSSLHKGVEFKMLVFHPEHFYVRAFAQALSAWGTFGWVFKFLGLWVLLLWNCHLLPCPAYCCLL